MQSSIHVLAVINCSIKLPATFANVTRFDRIIRPILRAHARREKRNHEILFLQTRLTEKLKQEEEERLCVLAEPLRHYLATYVLPTLTEALIEVAKLRPEDPIDFLVSTSSLFVCFCISETSLAGVIAR